MKISIESLQLSELVTSLRQQADDSFPDLKDEQRLNMLANKWYKYAEFCTCRNDNNQLVGMIAFYANQKENHVAYVPHVYVSSHYRRKGIFKQMLHEVESDVKMKGYYTIRLEVQNDNLEAQQAYMKQGFLYDKDTNKGSIYMNKFL